MEDKRNHSSLVVLACLIVAVLCCTGILVFKQLSKNSTPKSIFVNSIFDKVKSEKKEYNSFSIDGSLKLNIDSELLDESILDLINKLDLNYSVIGDNKENNYLFKLDSNYDNSRLFNGKAFIGKENRFYVYLTDIFDKWIKFESIEEDMEIETEDLLENLNLTDKNIEKLIDGLKENIINSLRNDYFVKEKVDDLTKITFTLNEDNIYDIIDNFIDNCDTDTKFKETIKDTFGVDSDYVFEELKKSFKEVKKEDFKGMEEIKFISYVDKNKELKKFVIDTKSEGQPIKLEIVFDNEDTSMNLYMMGIKFMSLEDKKVKDKDTTTETIKFNMMDMLTFDMILKYTIKYDINMDKVDVSNYVNANELTETDLNTIEEKLSNNEGIIKLIQAIQNMAQNSEDMFGSGEQLIDY